MTTVNSVGVVNNVPQQKLNFGDSKHEKSKSIDNSNSIDNSKRNFWIAAAAIGTVALAGVYMLKKGKTSDIPNKIKPEHPELKPEEPIDVNVERTKRLEYLREKHKDFLSYGSIIFKDDNSGTVIRRKANAEYKLIKNTKNPEVFDLQEIKIYDEEDPKKLIMQIIKNQEDEVTNKFLYNREGRIYEKIQSTKKYDGSEFVEIRCKAELDNTDEIKYKNGYYKKIVRVDKATGLPTEVSIWKKFDNNSFVDVTIKNNKENVKFENSNFLVEKFYDLNFNSKTGKTERKLSKIIETTFCEGSELPKKKIEKKGDGSIILIREYTYNDNGIQIGEIVRDARGDMLLEMDEKRSLYFYKNGKKIHKYVGGFGIIPYSKIMPDSNGRIPDGIDSAKVLSYDETCDEISAHLYNRDY